MQLTELTQIIAEEAALSRDSLLASAVGLTTLVSSGANQPVLDEAAFSYADFCTRSSQATESLGLSGLAWAASSIAHMLEPMPQSALVARASAAPLLTHWPDFFMAYLDGWSQGDLAGVDIAGLLVDLAHANKLVLWEEDQLRELEALLKSPPSLANQQAALLPKFELPDAEAMSLHVPEDSDADILDGFLAEGPAQIEQLSNIVADLAAGSVSAAQLELAHRNAHTLKGTAAISGVRGIATLAHALEDVLEAFRREDFVAPAGLHQVMAASCDQLDLALNHLANKTPVTEEFEQVTFQLHAWASHLQGIEVPAELLQGDGAQPSDVVSTRATQLPMIQLDDTALVAATEGAGDEAKNDGKNDTQGDEDPQVRISAKALDKVFRAVNELAIGLLRLRTQNDDLMNRFGALAGLDQVAALRLAEIESRVVLQGLGRAAENTTSGTGSSSNSSSSAGGTPKSDPPSRSNAGVLFNAEQEQQAGFNALEMDRYNELTGSTQALNEAMNDLRAARAELLPSIRDVNVLTQRQLDIAREARYQIAQARLRPLSGLRARLRRTVRQTCAVVGRRASIYISGDDLRVDAAVLGPLSEALLHLLRNSVDHGIEPPHERLALGKPEEGSIEVNFSARGSGVVITITDDGRGLDYAAILNKAQWSGLVPVDAALTDEEIGRLIFLPGFTTRAAVTETSGRGVGLDAVAQAVSSLQGNIAVSSELGFGSEFRLFVLSSIGTVHALLLEAGGEKFLVPSTQLERAEPAAFTVDVPAEGADEGGGMPVVSLPQLLHGTSQAEHRVGTSMKPSLVVNVDGLLRRIEVDRIIEAREYLVSPPPELIDRMPGISGVATLADGSLALVLDLIDLSRRPLPVQAQGLRDMQAALQEQQHVLVVDDSSSVRNTIGALLRDENYKVTLARDGLEAMRAMLDGRFSAVLTDLEMPQLNGFELTEFIRNRSDQPKVPVIMLTSRGQDKHREHALSVGVNAFLIKPYSDQNLLETVRAAIRGDADPGNAGQTRTAARARPIDLAVDLS
jgi:chemotaxis protein histidine kinase CheA/FixJ family two-component response regulator